MTLLRISTFIAVFFVLDTGIGYFLAPYYRVVTAPTCQNFYSRYVTQEGQDFDIVFVGDSRIQHGLNSPLMSRACDCAVGNIAVSGSTLVTSYYLLRDYLENHDPYLVVLEAHWSRLVAQPGGNHYPLLLEHLPVRDRIEYLTVSGDTRFLASALMRSYRYRMAFSRFIRRELPVQDSTGGTHNRTDEFTPLHSKFNARTDLALEVQREFGPFDLPADRTQMVYLEKTLDLLKSKNIPVLLVQPPEPIEVAESTKHLEALQVLISEIALNHMVPYIDLNASTDAMRRDKSLFSDVLHLNARGSEVYTERLFEGVISAYPSWKK